MRRTFSGIGIAIALIVTMAAPAGAGEVTGNGKSTPVQDYQAGSICSFSGQNDDPNEQPSPENGFDIFADGRVQSFGDIVQQAIGDLGDGKGASALVPIIRSMGPGVECRGYASAR